MRVAERLVDTDKCVRDAFAAVGTELPWSEEGLQKIPSLYQAGQLDLHSARVDLLEIDVRTILDSNGVAGDPSTLVAAVVETPDRDCFNESGSDDDDYGFLVPLRVLAGGLPVLDFFDFENDRPTVIDGTAWNLNENILIDDLEQIERARTRRLDGIDLAGFSHSIVIASELLDDFRIVEFGSQRPVSESEHGARNP